MVRSEATSGDHAMDMRMMLQSLIPSMEHAEEADLCAQVVGTAQARIEVTNPDELLRIEMYVDVEFTSQGAIAPVVPEAAVQSIGERRFVFLPVKDNEGSFKLREVQLGSGAGGSYSVLDGLKPEDEVVTDGSFILKAEAVRQHPELH
jgi:multidrug efflux pump subunit AcrA (membrane-fusion protein)